MRNAADYSDRWFKHTTDAGVNVEFNAYYVCRSGPAAAPCNTVIESICWDRLKDDPEATGQRWYCKCCLTRYRVVFGMLLEIIMDKSAMYCKSELPPKHIQDAKMMKIEEDFKPYSTPKELLEALPTISPLDKKVFLPPANRWSSKEKINGVWQ